MKNVPSELIRHLSEFDAATLYEAAGQEGMVDPAIRPMWQGARLCGPAMTVSCAPRDNLMLHHAVALAEPGAVLVANANGYQLAGAWGEVLTAAAQARGITGLAIDGAVRDIEAVAERRFPIFSRGLAIGACKKERLGSLNEPIELGGVTIRAGDLIVGTGDGLVVVKQEFVQDVLRSAITRRDREREILGDLAQGKTTIEILNLPRPAEKRGTSRK